MSPCEVCFKHNNHLSMSEKYRFVCLQCIDEGEAVECEYSGEWHIKLKCRGCDREGAANYCVDTDPQYFCGGSPRCVP